MDRNIRIARELVRIAKALAAGWNADGTFTSNKVWQKSKYAPRTKNAEYVFTMSKWAFEMIKMTSEWAEFTSDMEGVGTVSVREPGGSNGDVRLKVTFDDTPSPLRKSPAGLIDMHFSKFAELIETME